MTLPEDGFWQVTPWTYASIQLNRKLWRMGERLTGIGFEYEIRDERRDTEQEIHDISLWIAVEPVTENSGGGG